MVTRDDLKSFIRNSDINSLKGLSDRQINDITMIINAIEEMYIDKQMEECTTKENHYIGHRVAERSKLSDQRSFIVCDKPKTMIDRFMRAMEHSPSQQQA